MASKYATILGFMDARKSLHGTMNDSLAPNVEKLAMFWITLAASVRLRAVTSDGWSAAASAAASSEARRTRHHVEELGIENGRAEETQEYE